MGRRKKQKTVSVYFHLVFICLLAIGGLVGGVLLIVNPSGSLLSLPLSFLENSPFRNYLVPGMLLFILLGLFPLVVFYGLLKMPKWNWMKIFNPYKNRHWSWTFSFYTGLILILWIDFQIALIGYNHIIQFIYALYGVLILVFTMLPPVRKYYKK